MTKSELILKITSKNSYLYHKDVYKIIDTLFNCVTQALKDGDMKRRKPSLKRISIIKKQKFVNLEKGIIETAKFLNSSK